MDTPLHEAVAKQDPAAVKALLASGAAVNAKDEYGGTPLHWAAVRESVEVVRLLAAAGADVNARDADGWTPLRRAAEAFDPHVEVVEELLAAGADVNARDANGWTPLFGAVRSERADMVKALAGARADLSAKGDPGPTQPHLRGRSLLHYAVSEACPEVVEALIAAGADVNARTDGGLRPLFLAIESALSNTFPAARSRARMTQCAALLLLGGATDLAEQEGTVVRDRDDPARLSWLCDAPSLLFVAAENGPVTLVRLLLERGVDVNQKHPGETAYTFRGDHLGDTPLHWAVRSGPEEATQMLLAHGADVDAVNQEGETPLRAALAEKRLDVAEALYAHGADTSRPSLLDKAVDAREIEVVDWLLAHGASVNGREGESSRTPLHTAASNLQVEMVELLLTKGADVNALNGDRKTPLCLAQERAVYRRGEEAETVVRMLREHGGRE